MLLAPYPSTIVFSTPTRLSITCLSHLPPFEFVINLGCFNLNYWPNNLHFSLMLSHALSVPVGHNCLPVRVQVHSTLRTLSYTWYINKKYYFNPRLDTQGFHIFLVLIDSCCIIPYCFGHYYNIYSSTAPWLVLGHWFNIYKISHV
jgi:hypothetical protein